MSMLARKAHSAVLAVLFCSIGPAQAQSVQEDIPIQRTFEFVDGPQPATLEIDNIQGSIVIEGYDGPTVNVTVNGRIRAQSADQFEMVKQLTKLTITNESNRVRLFVEHPGRCDTTLRVICFDPLDKTYSVQYDFNILVPRRVALRIRSIRSGDIRVKNTGGDFNVEHVEGNIQLIDVSGSGSARTVKGDVTASFISNPSGDCYFGSAAGKITTTFPTGLSADLRYKTFKGAVYTDFAFTPVPKNAGSATRQGGKFVYTSNDFSGARLGKGGPEIKLEGLNGDIFILQTR